MGCIGEFNNGSGLQIIKTEIIYFSATGTTKAIVTAISKGLNSKVQLFDYIKQLQGNGTPLAAISVYGNMGFGISLEQFKNFAEMNNFRLIAAGAFIGQHTYASKEAPVAFGRPDGQDIQQAEIFAKSIQKKVDTGKFTCPEIPKCMLPGFITELPDSGTRFLVRQPRINKTACNTCGACVRKCPVGAIDPKTLKIRENLPCRNEKRGKSNIFIKRNIRFNPILL